MPCDIGYRNSVNLTVRKGEKELKAEAEAPRVDEELLELIGEKEPALVNWINDMDIYSLLESAFRKTLDALPDSDSLSYEILKNGKLKSKGKYASEAEKQELERINNEVFVRFEMEVFKIILELLGYVVMIYNGSEGITIEGEKISLSRVNKYVRIMREANGLNLRFEHFESAEAVRDEKNKFFAIAQKLGLKIDGPDSEIIGQPIPEGAIHEHFLKEKE